MKISFFASLVLYANIAQAYHIDGYAQKKGGHDKEDHSDQEDQDGGLIERRQHELPEERTFDINNNRAHRGGRHGSGEEGKGHHGRRGEGKGDHGLA